MEPKTPQELWLSLTPRESEIACMLARGDTNREIAAATGISIKTVDTHRAHVLKKLALKNNAALAVFCMRHGKIS